MAVGKLIAIYLQGGSIMPVSQSFESLFGHNEANAVQRRGVRLVDTGITTDGVTDIRDSLNALLTTLNSAGFEYVIVNHYTYVIGSNLTIPSGITMVVEKGGLLSVSSGATLTGTFQAGPYQIFTGSGTVSINAASSSQYGEWNNQRPDGQILTKSLTVEPGRYSLEWIAGQYGLPGLNADILNSAEATRMLVDRNFEVLAPTSGSNASSDDVTHNAEGGITLTTDGADGDGLCIKPHLDASQSAWNLVTWGTDQSTRWECRFRTGGNIGNAIIWAGLKLTDTDVVITDADQAYFRYENGVNDGEWQAVSSIGGTDTTFDTNVVVAINTEYHFVIDIQSDRTARFYINGTLHTTTAALNIVDLIPYMAIEADGAAEAKVLHPRGQKISRAFA